MRVVCNGTQILSSSRRRVSNQNLHLLRSCVNIVCRAPSRYVYYDLAYTRERAGAVDRVTGRAGGWQIAVRRRAVCTAVLLAGGGSQQWIRRPSALIFGWNPRIASTSARWQPKSSIYIALCLCRLRFFVHFFV